jgi:5-(carboxyamino)imidazole ribonucleotide synthase
VTGSAHAVVLPGATIGFLGGGQLGRMAALAARSMGYDVHVLDPDPHCPAAAVASRVVTARFDDVEAAVDLASQCAVVTLEIEQIARPVLEAAERHAPVRPGPAVAWIIQDRGRQKDWLAAHGVPLGAFRVAESEDACAAAVAELGPSVVKSCFGGYDGRGQARASTADEGRAAWRAVGARRVVVERFLDIALELSVLVARRPDGALVVYPPAVNHHHAGVLAWSMLPGPLPAELVERATSIAAGIATAMGVEGLLAVELFLLADGTLAVNELAPRPHNTYHASERGSVTSQFEQLVRAVCALPLGATDSLQPAAIVNLLGDLWMGGTPDFAAALSGAGVRVHLYGKRSARPGRKMGHLSTIGASAEDALAAALEAYERLGRGVAPGHATTGIAR